MLLAKTGIILTLVGVLILQWVLAVSALYLLFKDKGVSKNIIFWNVFIMFGIIVGPVTYFIVRTKKE